MKNHEQEASDRAKAIHIWGAQTIGFAMSQRALDLDVPLSPKLESLATQKVNDLVYQIWSESLAELKDKDNPDWIEAGFARRIFAWCYDHMNSLGAIGDRSTTRPPPHGLFFPTATAIAEMGEQVGRDFIDFFTAQIRYRNTRFVYGRQVG